MKNFIHLINYRFQTNSLLYPLLTLYISVSFSCENDNQKSAEINPDIIDSSVVMQNGLLTVSGNKILNKKMSRSVLQAIVFFGVTTTGVVSDFIIPLPLNG